MKLVAAFKMLPTIEQATCLMATLVRCNQAATWLAQVGYDAKTFRQYDLHKMAYSEVRSRFGLTAQAAVRTIAKVADAFKVNKDVAPVFRSDAAQPYDDRIIRFVKSGGAVSIWTLEGRIVVPITMGEHQKRLIVFRKGEVDLCLIRGKWILAATCDIPETDEFKPDDWLGVDFGIVSLAVDSDGKTYTGADVERTRSVAEIAYIAGLFDGEGCVAMQRRTSSSRYRPVVQISGAHVPMLEMVRSVFGGRTYKQGTQSGSKVVWTWTCGTIEESLEFLTAVRPFLMEKAKQADVALNYLLKRVQGNRRGLGAKDALIDRLSEETYHKLQSLKKISPCVLAA